MNLNPIDLEKRGDLCKVLDSFFLWTDSNDEHVGKNCRDNGYWEPDVTKWMIDNLKPGMKCLDVGFNIGYFTEVMARLVGKTGQVYSFEPNKEIVNNYSQVWKVNSYEDVAPIYLCDFGLSDFDGTADLVIPSINPGGAGISTVSIELEDYVYTKQTVDVKRLDSFYAEEVDFIKMDIEGSEPKAWAGFPDVVKNCPVMIMELGPYHPKEFLEELKLTHSMSDTNGKEITIEEILNKEHHLNVVLTRIG